MPPTNAEPDAAPVPRRPRRSVLVRWLMVAVAAGIVWRLVRYALNFELHRDEAYLLGNVLAKSYLGLLRPLQNGQVAPPAFLWELKLCDWLVPNEWSIRLLPLLAGLGSIVMFGLLCRLLLRGSAFWAALAILSVSHVPVIYSTRAKAYSIDLFVAVVLIWLAACWLRRPGRVRYALMLALLALPALWWSYTTGFVVAGVGLVLAARCIQMRSSVPGRVWAALALFLGLTVASAAALYAFDLREAMATVDPGLASFWEPGFPPLRHPLRALWWLIEVHTRRGFAWPIGEDSFASTATFVLWAVGIFALWQRRDRWVLALLLAPQAMLLAAACLHAYPYGANSRVSQFIGPGICILMGAGIAWLARRFGPIGRRRTMAVTAGILLAIALGGLGFDVKNRLYDAGHPGVRDTLAKARRELGRDGVVVVLDRSRATGAAGPVRHLFEYYVRRDAGRRVRWEGQLDPDEVHPSERVEVVAFDLDGPAEAHEQLAAFEQRFAGRLWPTWDRAVGDGAARLEVRVLSGTP